MNSIKRTQQASVATVALLFFVAPLFAAEDWNLRRDRDGIQVYTRDVADSRFDAVRTVTVMADVRLSSLVALFLDTEACPRWADRCDESYIHEQVSPTEAYVYTNNNMPFPFRDRDVLSHVRWRQDPQTLVVTMQSEATVGRLPEQDGRIRLTHANIFWQFTPLEDGAVEIINEAHVNPGASIPGWLANMLLVDTPFDTVRAITEEVRKPPYSTASIGFVTEPEDG